MYCRSSNGSRRGGGHHVGGRFGGGRVSRLAVAGSAVGLGCPHGHQGSVGSTRIRERPVPVVASPVQQAGGEATIQAIPMVEASAINALSSTKLEPPRPISPWRFSRAKAHLEACLNNPQDPIFTVPLTAEEVYRSNSLYTRYEWRNFQPNYNRLRNGIEVTRNVVEFDQRAFELESARFIRAPLTQRGLPFWDRLTAQSILRAELTDPDLGPIVSALAPSEVHARHEEYRAF